MKIGEEYAKKNFDYVLYSFPKLFKSSDGATPVPASPSDRDALVGFHRQWYGEDQLTLAPDIYVVGNVVTRGNPLMEAILDRGLAADLERRYEADLKRSVAIDLGGWRRRSPLLRLVQLSARLIENQS